MKRCPKCNRQYFDRVKHCRWCGIDFVIEEKTSRDEKATQNCWNCGECNLPDATHCSNCGERLDVNSFLARIGNELLKKRNINYCPRCNSRNIKLYRKGYDYKVGFWGAIFGVRGAGYAGGFDANNTCCRCMDCGKHWETDYDYRFINK
jgi:DNA-directed RNA polymerase subunit RPC12/RpoP